MSHAPGTPDPAVAGPREPVARGRRRGDVLTVTLLGAMILVAVLAMLSAAPEPVPPEPDRTGMRPDLADLVVATGAPGTWDPARIEDSSAAAALTQVWEGLTALDADMQVRPALARSWRLEDGGRRISFELRDGLRFSDGTPLRGQDVADSWLRVLDPADPSALASLLADVSGATEYLGGTGRREDVGIRATSGTVTVDFRRPAAYFPAVASAPTLAVVPGSLGDRAAGAQLPDDGLAVSGAYVPVRQDAGSIVLAANPLHWAGPPPIATVALLTDIGGRSPVEVFTAGDADYVTIGREDATWIAWDRTLGPQLRRSDDLSVETYAFDTTRPPFDDPRVRRAVAMAVDWDGLALLDDPDAAIATSLVPAGVPSRPEEDLSPRHDPDAARAELSAAGYPDGAGLAPVTIVSSGGRLDEAVASELERELGMRVEVEQMPFDDFSDRLEDDPPPLWSLEWVADYPHPQDFLGLLLGSGSSSNAGGWSDLAFDAALARAASTADPAAQASAYADAERIAREAAALVPVRYGETWALARDGLLGADQDGLGGLRLAGVAWGAG